MNKRLVRHVDLKTAHLSMFERERPFFPAYIAVDYVIVCNDVRQPKFHAMIWCGYDLELAARKFDQAVLIAQKEESHWHVEHQSKRSTGH